MTGSSVSPHHISDHRGRGRADREAMARDGLALGGRAVQVVRIDRDNAVLVACLQPMHLGAQSLFRTAISLPTARHRRAVEALDRPVTN